MWGLFIKSVIADRAGIYVDSVYSAIDSFPAINCLLASILYTLQIYADFAGYSFMAVGVASLLGFKIVNNFKRPYLAASVTEFLEKMAYFINKVANISYIHKSRRKSLF